MHLDLQIICEKLCRGREFPLTIILPLASVPWGVGMEEAKSPESKPHTDQRLHLQGLWISLSYSSCCQDLHLDRRALLLWSEQSECNFLKLNMCCIMKAQNHTKLWWDLIEEINFNDTFLTILGKCTKWTGAIVGFVFTPIEGLFSLLSSQLFRDLTMDF